MPGFAGKVFHNNSTGVILDTTDGQVKGYGVFANTSARNDLSINSRVTGFLAIVGSTAYVYANASILDTSWEDASNWTEIGSGSGLDHVVEDLSPQLGGDLDVFDGTTAFKFTTSETNGDIQFTPNGTGKINLDGTVQFKRFAAGSPPAAFEGGMYADENDDLYFGTSDS